MKLLHHTPVGVACLAALLLASLTIGCAARAHDHFDTVDIVDAHGYHHCGYYDDHHDWHGGYDDESHVHHDDPNDWH
jgi:hypothetical protein